MAEEEKEDSKQQAEEPEAEAAEEAPEAEAEEAPAEEAGEDAPAAEAEEAPAEEADEAPAEEADEAPAEEADEAPAEGDEQAAAAAPAADDDETDWKTRHRLERSRRPAEARPQRGAEERQAERAESRRRARVARGRHRKSRRARKGEPGTGTSPAERRPNPTKVRQGVVVSDKADKTITVRIDIARRHPSYEKIVRRSRTLRAHDEQNEAGEGDIVKVIETRPLSRSKRWRLVEVVEKAQ